MDPRIYISKQDCNFGPGYDECVSMIISDYIKQKFQSFGISLSEADLVEINLSSGVDPDGVVAENNLQSISVAIARFIPSLLLRATSKSVSENGHSKSLSWDISGIKSYYSFLCNKYGLEDELNIDKPKVIFR